MAKKTSKNVKKSRFDIPYVSICPKCKSTQVKDRGMISKEAYSNMHCCLTCGFEGPIFPEIPLSEAEKLPVRPVNFNPSTMPIFADKATINIPWKQKSMRQKITIIFLGILTIFLLLLLLSSAW